MDQMSGRARGRGGDGRESDVLRTTDYSSGAGTSSVETTGRAAIHKRKNEQSDNGNGNGNGNGSSVSKSKIISRGAVRGSRPVQNIYRTRPEGSTKKGQAGKQLNLTANYFRVLKKPDFDMCQYRVDFAPENDSIYFKRAMLRQHHDLFGGYIFDGTVMFLNHKLPQNLVELISKTKEDTLVKITLKYTGTVSSTDGQSLQILNLILRKAMEGLKLELVGRNYFDAAAKINIEEYKLQLWPGYITSIRQHEQDILLCSEISHKIMRMETVLDIIKYLSRENVRDWKDVFTRQMIGAVVLTEYNNKTYRVDDIDWNSSPSSTFDTKTGPLSYNEYYKKRYNKNIRDLRQPLLISKPKARDIRGGQSELICLIPELCRATGLTDEMRNNFRLMRAMSDHTRLNPRGRAERLMVFNKRLQNSTESAKVLGEWNLDLDKNLVQFAGRLLPQEVIKFNGNEVKNQDDADWTRSLRNCNMFVGVDLTRWCVIYPARNEREAEDFIKCLKNVCNGMHYNCGEPKRTKISDDRTDSYLRALDEFLNMDPRLIMCIVPNNRADRYSAIKKRTCVDRAVPTQVILTKTITPKQGGGGALMSVATKVVIQLNCKLGGAPWMVNMPISGLMTIGFDVCHDTKDKSKSYGAMVATMDLKQSIKYFSAATQHNNGEELSNQLVININKALKCYREEHGCLPARILFYRDGVGDGQLEYVHSHEVVLIKNKLDEIYKVATAGEVKFCYIVVNKRLNTRIFNNGNNPGSGTVVDDVITLPERYDFYLISQTVRQGTVSPTSYNIIEDTFGLAADKLQILTYKMCHLYYNWSGTTRVPAVCQYAHKLAFLVGNFIHQSPSNALEKQLYFL